MRDYSKMAKRKENISSSREMISLYTKVNGQTVKDMARVSKLGQMDEFTMVRGETTKCTGMEF